MPHVQQATYCRFTFRWHLTGGFDLAFSRCGIRTAWAAENDAKCNSIRRRHFPHEETILDVAVVSGPRFRADILVGGFPCQDLSVAGKRAGLAGKRSGLWWEFARIIEEQAPRWVLIENVSGLLSSNRGRDFGTVLGTLAKLRYGFAYRILDAQWWGVPQRRRRVFIVGYLGNWRRAAEVLFESESVPWDSPPSREAGAEVAPTVRGGTESGSNEIGNKIACFGGNNTSGAIGVATACNAKGGSGRMDFESETMVVHTLRAEGFDAGEDGTGRGTPIIPIDMRQASRGGTMTNNRSPGSSGGAPGTGIGDEGDPSPTLANSHTPAIAYQCQGTNVGPMGTLRAGNGNETGGVPFVFQTRIGRNDRGQPEEVCPTLQGANAGATSDMRPCVHRDMMVRRLTPRECERLMGFKDDWTRFGENGEEIADGPRYRMVGNAVAVPVAEWIGKRIMEAAES